MRLAFLWIFVSARAMAAKRRRELPQLPLNPKFSRFLDLHQFLIPQNAI